MVLGHCASPTCHPYFKFQTNMLNSFQVKLWTKVWDGWKDGRTETISLSSPACRLTGDGGVNKGHSVWIQTFNLKKTTVALISLDSIASLVLSAWLLLEYFMNILLPLSWNTSWKRRGKGNSLWVHKKYPMLTFHYFGKTFFRICMRNIFVQQFLRSVIKKKT